MTEAFFAGRVPLALGAKLGAGGEGEVFAVEGEPALAVKLFKPAGRRAREAKVAAMVDAAFFAATRTIAFPVDLVRDAQGAFAGFTMARVAHARALHELTSPVSRRTAFPQADVRFLVRTALNAARAVAAVHDAGCVVGDINHSGFLITDDARVMIIDADSFQFAAGGKVYRCQVGVPEYTPPELMGRPLATVERTHTHDAFGLAVVLFQLLFLGRHPYAGVVRGPRMGVEEAMRGHRFAYAEARQTGLAPPPATLRLGDWPEPLGDAFERAFGAAGTPRPAAAEWVAVLEGVEDALADCTADAMHARPHTDAPCPWCRVEGAAKTKLFSLAPSNGGALAAFDAHAARSAVDAARLPETFSYIPPPLPPGETLPVPNRRMVPRFVKWAACAFTIGAGGWLTVLVPQSFVMLLIVGYGAVSWLRVPQSAPARSELETLDRQIVRTIHAIQEEPDLDAIWLAKGEAEAALAERVGLAEAMEDAARHFRAERADAARQRAMAELVITPAAGAAPGEVEALAASGIRSAADVLRRTSGGAPGVTAEASARLAAWAADALARFVPPDALSEAEAAELVRRQNAIAARAPHLERRLADAIATLSEGAAAFQATADRREPMLDDLIRRRAPLVAEIEHYREDAPARPSPPPRRPKRETEAKLRQLARRG